MRIVCLAAIAMFGAAGAANAQDFALGVQAGTSGVGAQVQFRAGTNLVLRGNGDWLNFGHDETYEGVAYSGTFKFATAGAFADWHPFNSWFLISGGGYIGQRNIDLAAAPKVNTAINGINYTPAQIGQLDGTVKYSSFQPFAGIGIDNTFYGEGLSFDFVLGVAFGGSPAVSLNSTNGTLSNDATFQKNLAAERDKIVNDANNFSYYPIAYFALTYRL